MMITSPLLAVASDHHLSPSISALQPSASFFISSKSPSAAKWCGNSQSGRALISLTNETAALAAAEISEGSLLAPSDIFVARQ